MELKVWCDGIQRVVCGASVSTTCQDIVFALAHATGQTGRFILIEKWRNSERVLAPSDRPLTSLAKWGEYANDVTFVMKRSGDVSSQSKQNKLFTLPSKKSDSELLHKRKALISSLINNTSQDKQNVDKCIATSTSRPSETTHAATLPVKSKAEPFVRSISYHKASSHTDPSSQHLEGSRGNYSQLYPVSNGNDLRLKSERTNTTQPPPLHNEPLYSTLSKNRPPQPPPYKEAITKSTLFNAAGPSANSIYGYSGSSFSASSQQGTNGQHSVLDDQNATKKLDKHLSNNYSPNRPKSLSSLHHDTMNLIDMQQQTMKSQEKDITNIEQELDIVQRKLSENELVVKRYKEEMDLLKQLWVEQDALIEKLESEHMEEELNQLLDEAKKYQENIDQVNQKLTVCENEVCKCREEICILMSKIEGTLNNKTAPNSDSDDTSLMEHLHKTIQEKNKEIDTQNCDLKSLNASIERLDKSIQEKEDIIEKLTIEIKEANVEGLSLQSSALYVEEKDTANCEPVTVRVGSNRKIPALPRELGNTVPTKKNPDGIWV